MRERAVAEKESAVQHGRGRQDFAFSLQFFGRVFTKQSWQHGCVERYQNGFFLWGQKGMTRRRLDWSTGRFSKLFGSLIGMTGKERDGQRTHATARRTTFAFGRGAVAQEPSRGGVCSASALLQLGFIHEP